MLVDATSSTMSPGASAAFASLETRVDTLGADFVDIKKDLSGLNLKLDANLAAITTKLDERSKFNWGPISAMAGVSVAAVAFFWNISTRPTDIAIQRLEISVAEMGRSLITREEVRAGRERFDRDLKVIQDNLVPRGEHSEKWRANDQALVNIQRQIDEFRKESGSTYTLRDKVVDMNKRIEELNSLLMKSGWPIPSTR